MLRSKNEHNEPRITPEPFGFLINQGPTESRLLPMVNQERIKQDYLEAVEIVTSVQEALVQSADVLQYDPLREQSNMLLGAHCKLTAVLLELRKGFND